MQKIVWIYKHIKGLKSYVAKSTNFKPFLFVSLLEHKTIAQDPKEKHEFRLSLLDYPPVKPDRAVIFRMTELIKP